jgi:hypothetical protein
MTASEAAVSISRSPVSPSSRVPWIFSIRLRSEDAMSSLATTLAV